MKYCPSCGTPLQVFNSFDSNATDYICSNGHRLFIQKSSILAIQHMGEYLNLNSGRSLPKDVFKEWLQNETLRSHLNNQLASVVLYILESLDEKEIETPGYNEYNFCPLCAAKLTKIESDDLYVSSCECINKHVLRIRGGIWREGKNLLDSLQFRPNREQFRSFLEFWLTNSHAEEFIPHELRKHLKPILGY